TLAKEAREMSETRTLDERRAAGADTSQLAARLTQAFHDRYQELLDGARAGEPTWVTSGGPEGGLNGTLAALDAEQASRDVAGTSAAAHAEHVRWAIQMVNDHFDGIPPSGDWSASWTVKVVDQAEWDRLRIELRQAGERLLSNVLAKHDWRDELALIGALASYGHTAYHLGALRQFQKQVEGGRHA